MHRGHHASSALFEGRIQPTPRRCGPLARAVAGGRVHTAGIKQEEIVNLGLKGLVLGAFIRDEALSTEELCWRTRSHHQGIQTQAILTRTRALFQARAPSELRALRRLQQGCDIFVVAVRRDEPKGVSGLPAPSVRRQRGGNASITAAVRQLLDGGRPSIDGAVPAAASDMRTLVLNQMRAAGGRLAYATR